MKLKKFMVGMMLAATTVSMLGEALARPMGGGRSFGRQSQNVGRQAPAPAPTPAPAAAPRQAQPAPAPRRPLPPRRRAAGRACWAAPCWAWAWARCCRILAWAAPWPA
ncbi:hypothetical protein [Janthinobacterium lividum]